MKRKRSEFSFPETKKLKITQYPKLSENYSENSKGKLPEELNFYPIYTLSILSFSCASWALRPLLAFLLPWVYDP